MKARGKPPENWRELFLEAFEKACIVESACAAASVSRSTFYATLKTDLKFRNAFNELKMLKVLQFEDYLAEAASKGNAACIIFGLKKLDPKTYGDLSEAIRDFKKIHAEIKTLRKQDRRIISQAYIEQIRR